MLIDPFYRELKYKNLFRTLKQKALDDKDYLSAMLLRVEEKHINEILDFKIRIKEYRKFIQNYNDHNGYWFT